MQDVYREGARRFENRIPPGFKDQKKPEPDRYGDLIVWKQILDEAEKRKTATILVTSETHDDWWWMEDGKRLGPHYLLVKEFRDRVARPFYMYPPDRFMEESNIRLKRGISARAIEEVSEVQKAEAKVFTVPDLTADLALPDLAWWKPNLTDEERSRRTKAALLLLESIRIASGRRPSYAGGAAIPEEFPEALEGPHSLMDLIRESPAESEPT